MMQNRKLKMTEDACFNLYLPSSSGPHTVPCSHRSQWWFSPCWAECHQPARHQRGRHSPQEWLAAGRNKKRQIVESRFKKKKKKEFYLILICKITWNVSLQNGFNDKHGCGQTQDQRTSTDRSRRMKGKRHKLKSTSICLSTPPQRLSSEPLLLVCLIIW